MEDQKISSAIDVAVSLIRTAKFIGIDEDAQAALENFVESLDDDETFELNEKQSLSDLKTLSSFFDRKVHEASHVCFEVRIENTCSASPDLTKIQVVGPARKANIFLGEISEGNDMLSYGHFIVYVIADIDHDRADLVERYSHKMSSVEMKLSVIAPYKIEITKQTYF